MMMMMTVVAVGRFIDTNNGHRLQRQSGIIVGLAAQCVATRTNRWPKVAGCYAFDEPRETYYVGAES